MNEIFLYSDSEIFNMSSISSKHDYLHRTIDIDDGTLKSTLTSSQFNKTNVNVCLSKTSELTSDRQERILDNKTTKRDKKNLKVSFKDKRGEGPLIEFLDIEPRQSKVNYESKRRKSIPDKEYGVCQCILI